MSDYNSDPARGRVGFYDQSGYVGGEETRKLNAGEVVTLDDGTRWMLNKPASCVRITSENPMGHQHWQPPD
jgi:hypothetical protein